MAVIDMSLLRRQMPQIPTDPAYYEWSIQRQLSAITLSLMVIAFVAVVGRVYIRLYVLRLFRLDDYFMVAAMICSTVGCSIFLHVVQLGMGKHIFAIKPQNFTPLLMWIWVVSVIIPIALCLVKFSIAFFLLSLTRGTRYGRALWVIIGFLTIFMIFTFVTLMVGCVPIESNWNYMMRPPPIGKGTAKCMPTSTYRNIAFVNSITNIVTDIVLALMPVPLIWTLQVNKRTKASLIFILGLGFFACAAGIIKTPLLFHFFDDFDSTGNRSWYYAWQIIEMNVGILAATLPSLKPAFRWLLETAKALTTGHSANRSAASPGYQRQFSSGYMRQRNGGDSNNMSLGNTYAEKGIRGAIKTKDIETELNDLGPYHVTVAGDNKSVESGERSNASSDAILRLGDAEGPDSRRIFRTTKVTIVTT